MGYSREFLNNPTKMLKSSIAKQNNERYEVIDCWHCINWSKNQGGSITSNDKSWCKIKKKNTLRTSFCKYFKRKPKIGGRPKREKNEL